MASPTKKDLEIEIEDMWVAAGWGHTGAQLAEALYGMNINGLVA